MAGGLVLLLLVLIAAIGYVVASASAGVTPSPSPSPTPSPSPSPTPSPTPSPSPSPTPSPTPTPTPVYEDLSGIPTTPELAHRYPIAVMLDDHPDARPQAGLAWASVVYQAPVEADIPRYMAVFQSGTPPSIGPVRSARLYFVKWASELRAVYMHWGGPPPLLGYLAAGRGGVINADGPTGQRVPWRAPPHNVYTTGEALRAWAESAGADEEHLGYDQSALWRFRDPLPLEDRGRDGGTIAFTYSLETVLYRYDQAADTWLRFVDGHEHHDAGDQPIGSRQVGLGPRIQPRTVIVMRVPMVRAGNINGPALGAVEADAVGENDAWIFADGHVTKGRWRKPDDTARTRFLDEDGDEIALPRGQIFIQVVNDRVSFDFEVAPAP